MKILYVEGHRLHRENGTDQLTRAEHTVNNCLPGKSVFRGIPNIPDFADAQDLVDILTDGNHDVALLNREKNSCTWGCSRGSPCLTNIIFDIPYESISWIIFLNNS